MKTIEHTSADSDLYAFPKSQAPSFTNWVSKRVLLTGSNGFLSASVNEVTDGLVWFIFKGATVPVSWDKWIAKIDFSIAAEINKIPRADMEVTGGQEVSWINDQNETLRVRYQV